MGKSWIKLWARWYESSSHALLSPQALHTGPHLLVLAGKYGQRPDGSAALVGPDGEPFSVDELALLTRWSARAMRAILMSLAKAGTLTPPAEDGGPYVFERFTRYQESPSAARVRRHRERSATVTVTPEKQHIEPVTVTRKKPPKTEDRRQKTDSPPTPQGAERGFGVEISELREGLSYQVEQPKQPNGNPIGQLRVRDQDAREVLRAGYGVETLVATAQWLSEEITAGRASPKLWGALFWTRWLDSLVRREVPEQFAGSPQAAPTMTKDEAVEYAAKHNRPPPGWEWSPRGRGDVQPEANR